MNRPDLDSFEQFMRVLHKKVPSQMIGLFMERLQATNCPIAPETIPHISAACSQNYALLTAENEHGVFVRAIPNDFVGVVQW